MIQSTSTTSNTFETLGLTRNTMDSAGSSGELGQQDFLTLMTTQLQSQDPLNPMESEQFMGNIAQFTTVDGIHRLEAAFDELASSLVGNQTLQASQLVGRSVLIPGSIGTMTAEDGMSGAVELPEMVADLTLRIYDSAGQLVRSINMSGSGPGLVDFTWDGLDDSGQAMPPGQYQFALEGTVGGENQRFDTFTLAQVQSVSVGSQQGPMLVDTGPFGEVAISEIREIR